MRLLLLGFCLVLGCLAAVQQQRPQPVKVRAVGRPIVKLGAVTHRPLRPRVMRDWRTHDWRIPTTPNPLKNAWDKLLNSRTTTLSPVYPPWMTVATTPWPTPFKGFGSTQPPRGPGIFTAPALPTTKRPANGGAAGGGGLIVFPTTPRHIATRKPFFTTTPRPRLPNNVPEFTDAPLDYCEYFASLGIDKPECRPPVAPEPEYGTCHRKFLLKTCKQNSACPQSGLLCMDVMSESCCAPPADQCPTPEQLGINCLKAKPTNWCTENYHCAGAQKLCCPTGCNYNICI